MIENKKYLRISIRIFSLLLVFFYLYTLIYFPLDPIKINLRYFSKFLLISAIFNLGPVLITFEIRKKYPLIITILYSLSILLSSLILGMYFLPALIVFPVIGVTIFWKFNPWRNIDYQSI